MAADRSRFTMLIGGCACLLALAAPAVLARRSDARSAVRPPEAAFQDQAAAAAPIAAAPLPPPERIAALFGWKAAAAPSAAPSPKPKTRAADWIRLLGAIETGDGPACLFFKDEHSGRILRVRRDGTGGDSGDYDDAASLVEETRDSFLLRYRGELLLVPRRP